MDGDVPEITRRAMLGMAALGPLAVLDGRASAMEEMTQVCDATKVCKGKVVDTEKLMKVATHLWQAFLSGLPAGQKLEGGVFLQAFQMSGPFVICNLDDFDPEGEHSHTMQCAKDAGTKSAAKAGSGEITPAHFEQAWCEVRAEMTEKIAKARRLNLGRKPGEELKDPHVGLGCG